MKKQNTEISWNIVIPESISEEEWMKPLCNIPAVMIVAKLLKENGHHPLVHFPVGYKKVQVLLVDQGFEVAPYQQGHDPFQNRKKTVLISARYPFLNTSILTEIQSAIDSNQEQSFTSSSIAHAGAEELLLPIFRYDGGTNQAETKIRVDYQTAIAIDSGISRENLELLLESLRLRKRIADPEHPVSLLVLDADGVLNDAGFYYGPEGEVMKKYNTRDGAGLKQIQALGVEIGIITGEKSGFTPARAEKLGIARIETGCSNKLPVLEKWKTELGLDWKSIAYMGDDLPDIPCLIKVGVPGCPGNAEPEVRRAAHFISTLDGGHGCVREFIRYMIQEKFIVDLKS